MSDKLTITDLDGSVTEIELDIDEKIEAIVAYRLRQRTRELNAAERRVQELEAQLAAQAWRPVTEPPTEQGTFLIYDADGEPYLFAGVWPYRVARWNNGWGSGLDGLVDFWQPLPAPPQDTPASGRHEPTATGGE